jgi:hypothetical protein
LGGSFPLPAVLDCPIPEFPRLLLFAPRFWIAPEDGKGGIGLFKKLLSAIAINGLIQDSLHGLVLPAGKFPQNRKGAFIDANASARHEVDNLVVPDAYRIVYVFVTQLSELNALYVPLNWDRGKLRGSPPAHTTGYAGPHPAVRRVIKLLID